MLNGLHLYFPDVPELPLSLGTGGLFTEAPWNQIGQFQLRVWPVAVGISYLLTSEISLSLWVFFLIHKFELVTAYYLGYMPASIPDPVWTRGFAKGFVAYQQFGAIFAYSLAVLWLGREHGMHIFRRAIGREKARPSGSERSLILSGRFLGISAVVEFHHRLDNGGGRAFGFSRHAVGDLSGFRHRADAVLSSRPDY